MYVKMDLPYLATPCKILCGCQKRSFDYLTDFPLPSNLTYEGCKRPTRDPQLQRERLSPAWVSNHLAP